MVFPHVPVYLDHPNWHQQLNHHQQGTGSENPQLPVPPPLPTQTDHHHNVGTGSIRAGSTADRARLANKVPQPEVVQKCPRCKSTNTKFCYFNNYSLTQPRHFCKTCRRYWTRGGALRSVPVGGGCRRNKKKKSSNTSSSKSTVSAERQSGSNSANNAVNIPSEITAHFPHQTPHLPNFMTSLQSFSQYGMGNIGLNLGGIHSHNGQGDHMGFQIGTNQDILSVRSWNHPQQFPFFEPNDNGLYNPLQSEYMEASASMVGSETQFLPSTSPSPRVSQRGPVKTENNNQGQGINLTRSLMLGASDNQNNNQYWEGIIRQIYQVSSEDHLLASTNYHIAYS